MSDWNGFGGLDLNDIEADSGRLTLKPGMYACKITGAEVKDTRDRRGKTLELNFLDTSGNGEIKDWINLKNSNADAERIGLQKLKALLIAAHHPNPNRPGDVKTLVGLTVGVRVEQGEDWVDTSTGQTKPGGGKVRRNGAYFDPSSGEFVLGPSPEAARKPAAKTGGRQSFMGDEIPFFLSFRG